MVSDLRPYSNDKTIMSTDVQNPETAKQLGKELVGTALRGLAGGAGAAGLYYLLSGLRTADPASVLPETKLMGVTNSSRLPRKSRKAPPSRSPDSPINTYKSAAQGSALDQLYTTLGSLPKTYLPNLGKFFPGGGPKAETGAQEMWRTLANVGLAGGGAYVGLSAVNRLADQQRHEDSKDDVEKARQEYFAALTGKSAEYLDQAFDHLTKAAEGSALMDLLAGADRLAGKYIATPAALTALGTGLVGGTYMYNQVKDRTRAENLRRAAAARARLAGLQKTPYVDPVELAALTKK